MGKTCTRQEHIHLDQWNIKQNKKDDANRIQQDKGTVYYSCRNTINRKIRKDKPNCPAQTSKCYKCQHMGHFGKFCKSTAEITKVDENR